MMLACRAKKGPRGHNVQNYRLSFDFQPAAASIINCMEWLRYSTLQIFTNLCKPLHCVGAIWYYSSSVAKCCVQYDQKASRSAYPGCNLWMNKPWLIISRYHASCLSCRVWPACGSQTAIWNPLLLRCWLYPSASSKPKNKCPGDLLFLMVLSPQHRSLSTNSLVSMSGSFFVAPHHPRMPGRPSSTCRACRTEF